MKKSKKFKISWIDENGYKIVKLVTQAQYNLISKLTSIEVL